MYLAHWKGTNRRQRSHQLKARSNKWNLIAQWLLEKLAADKWIFSKPTSTSLTCFFLRLLICCSTCEISLSTFSIPWRSSSLDIRSEGSSVTTFFSSLWPSEPTKITSESITFHSHSARITCRVSLPHMRSHAKERQKRWEASTCIPGADGDIASIVGPGYESC